MSVDYQLDHLVIAVNDLRQAIENYTALGFNVVIGGRHQHAPTQNALVYFEDGTYLELIEWTAPAPGEKWFEHLTQHGEGLVDVALVPSDVQAAVNQAARGGVQYRGPIDGSRVKPTGEQVLWQLGWPVQWSLPFLCGDITPRSLRVPEGAVRKQPNQASGVRSIAIRVQNLAVSSEAYRALLGIDPGEVQVFDTEAVAVSTFVLGEHAIHLVAATGTRGESLGGRLTQALRTRGEGIYCAWISSAPALASGKALAELGHGAALRMAPAPVTLLEQIRPVI